MKIALAAAAMTLTAGTAALAGGYTPPVVEEVPVIAPVPAPVVTGDWTGFRAGVQLGLGSAELQPSRTAPGFDEDLKAYGLHAGYDHDFGRFVLGGELDYNKLDIDNLDDKADLTRLRLRAGYDMDRFMPYVTLGAARISGDYMGESIKETAATYGIGAEFKATDNITFGGEYSYQKWKDVNDIDGHNLDTGLFQIRASYRF